MEVSTGNNGCKFIDTRVLARHSLPETWLLTSPYGILEKLIAICMNQVRLFEIAAVIVTGIGKFVFVDVLHVKFWYIIVACVGWSLYIAYRIRQRKDRLAYWGFRKDGFRQSLRMVLPVAIIAVGALVAYGLWCNVLILNAHIFPILLLYPLWGTIQQFLIIGLLVRNLSDLEGVHLPAPVVVLVASAVFSIVHFPSWPLVVATFFLALFYAVVYRRHRNLWVLGIFHGWLGGFFYFFALQRDPWLEFMAAVCPSCR